MALAALLELAIGVIQDALGAQDDKKTAFILTLLMPYIGELLGTQEASARALIQIEASRKIRELGLA